MLQANPFTFVIQGTGFLEPKFQLSVNSQSIDDEESAPEIPDGTDFGATMVGDEGATVVYTITNTGSATLNLTGTPMVEISGDDASDFQLTQPSVGSLDPGDSTTFEVQFVPAGGGMRTAALAIDENDPVKPTHLRWLFREPAWRSPSIAISSNSQPIPDGDTSPATTNNTDFGNTAVAGTGVTETFTIANSGTAALDLTGTAAGAGQRNGCRRFLDHATGRE